MASETRAADRDPLSAEAVAAGLADRPGWSGDTTAIERTVEAPTFLGAIAVVDAVAAVAEELDHHPDIDIRWRAVRLVLSTHSSGGVTATDLRAAALMDDAIDRAIATGDG